MVVTLAGQSRPTCCLNGLRVPVAAAVALQHQLMCPYRLPPAGTILTKSSLNPLESVELGRLVMSQNKKQLLDNWWKVGWPVGAAGRVGCYASNQAWCLSTPPPILLRFCDPTLPSLPHKSSTLPHKSSTCVLPFDCWPQEGKLAASEELGDLFKSAADWDTAQAIYQQAGASGKVVEALAAKGDFDQLVRKGAVAGSGGWWKGPLLAVWLLHVSACLHLPMQHAKELMTLHP